MNQGDALRFPVTWLRGIERARALPDSEVRGLGH